MAQFENAVIVGAGFSGLMAARMLASRFRTVTILERSANEADRYSDIGRDVPQQHHAHHLLFEGKRIIDKFFPEYKERLLGLGGKILDFGSDFRFFQYGRWREPQKLDADMYLAERPLLERVMLKSLESDKNINVRWGISAEICSEAGAATVEFTEKESGLVGQLKPDLIMDCRGRWNAPKLQQQTARIDVWYSTFFLDFANHDTPDWTVLIGYNRRPQQRIACYAGYTSPGNSHLQFTVMTYGYRPPANRNELIEHLTDHGPAPIFAKLLEQGTSRDKAMQLRFSNMFIDHAQPEQNVIRLGDAASSVDPVTGVGITKAAKEVEILDDILEHSGSIEEISRKFHQDATKLRSMAWQLLREQNSRFEPKGYLPPPLSFYVDMAMMASQDDDVVFKRLVDIRNLLRPLNDLWQVGIVWRVAKHLFKRKILGIKSADTVAPECPIELQPKSHECGKLQPEERRCDQSYAQGDESSVKSNFASAL